MCSTQPLLSTCVLVVEHFTVPSFFPIACSVHHLSLRIFHAYSMLIFLVSLLNPVYDAQQDLCGFICMRNLGGLGSKLKVSIERDERRRREIWSC
jgi:hypothetical protein